MTHILLKFSPEMAYAAIVGQKCCTARDEIKGERGDIFEIGGVPFRVLGVLAVRAKRVALEFFGQEGFEDTESCSAALQTIYPEVGGEDFLFVHFFARCPE